MDTADEILQLLLSINAWDHAVGGDPQPVHRRFLSPRVIEFRKRLIRDEGRVGTDPMGTFRYRIRYLEAPLQAFGLSFLTIVTSVAVFFLVGASILFVLNTRYLVKRSRATSLSGLRPGFGGSPEAVARKAIS